jgi:hypothetical protein
LLLSGIAELGARLAFKMRGVDHAPRWALQHAVLSALSQVRPGEDGIRFERPLAMEDQVTGYRCIPGVHRLAMVHQGKRKEFRVTIGDDGYRVTSNRVSPTRPVLALHGCSFTWGFLLNDEETYPWKLQELMPEYSVRNLAQNGFGTAHAYLQAKAITPPAVAIVVYAAFHRQRNSPSQEWMKQMVASGDAFKARSISYPWVKLENGLPIVDLRPMGFGASGAGEGNPPEPVAEEQNTLALMRAIRKHYSAAGTRFAVAAFTGIRGDSVMERLVTEGLHVVDLSLGSPDYLPDEYKMLPWDSFHPGSKATSIYAERMVRFIREID